MYITKILNYKPAVLSRGTHGKCCIFFRKAKTNPLCKACLYTQRLLRGYVQDDAAHLDYAGVYEDDRGWIRAVLQQMAQLQ